MQVLVASVVSHAVVACSVLFRIPSADLVQTKVVGSALCSFDFCHISHRPLGRIGGKLLCRFANHFRFHLRSY